jgi:metallo-beta-lactamase family protein
VRHDLFLVHGEAAAIDALAARLDGVVAADHILRPVLDETFELTPHGVRRHSVTTEPRLPPEKLARLDWHNDVSRLILDINDALAATADDRARDVLIRRLQSALEDDADHANKRHASSRS